MCGGSAIACPACSEDPCKRARCSIPGATCRIKECSCDAEFVLGGRVVACQTPSIPPPSSPCPKGVPIVNCFADPCQVNTCEAFPEATCVSNFCGGCNADFFVDGKKVNCSGSCVKTVSTAVYQSIKNAPREPDLSSRVGCKLILGLQHRILVYSTLGINDWRILVTLMDQIAL